MEQVLHETDLHLSESLWPLPSTLTDTQQVLDKYMLRMPLWGATPQLCGLAGAESAPTVWQEG